MRGKQLVSEQLYEALLPLYPKEFRAAYGRQMTLTFRDACRVVYHRNGTIGLLALWLPTLIDLIKSAFEERARQGEITMSKAKLISLAGPLTILAGSMWLVAFMAILIILTRLASVEAFWSDLWFFTYYLSFVPLLFALIGTYLCFHQAAGILGRLGLALSMAGCAGMIVIALVFMLQKAAPEIIRPGLWIDTVTDICFIGVMIGYLLFGVNALRYKVLPRWNLLPLLAGSNILSVFAAILLDVTPDNPLIVLPFIITGTCWVLIGIALSEPRREPQPAAAI